MIVMGVNTWDFDAPERGLVIQALLYADQVKESGIAKLRNFYLAHDQKLLWCTWDTDDFDGLQAAFHTLNAESGLKSTLYVVEDKFPYQD